MMQLHLQDRTCARCGLRFQVAPAENDPGIARVDDEAFKRTCELQSEFVNGAGLCPEFRKAWERPMLHDPKRTA